MIGAAIAIGALIEIAGARTAGAETAIAIDFNVGTPRVRTRTLSAGQGFDARAGKEISIGSVRLALEGCAGYASLGSTVVRALAGLRFGVVAPVAPVLFAHVGYGAIAYAGDIGSGPASGIVTGPAFDAGLALDLRPLSLFGVGVHAIYNGVQVSSDNVSERNAFSRSHWISLGAHAGVYF